jgi:hypothetical protein
MMMYLLDCSPTSYAKKLEESGEYILGQLLTPLTRFRNLGGTFAIDNGAFSGFSRREFSNLLRRQQVNRDRCLFVTIPDIVGNARRTLETWKMRHDFAPNWPHALVAQNGLEDLDIPWSEMTAVFIGGDDNFKDSNAAYDIVKTAKILGRHVHVGRVNGAKRYMAYSNLGADTCDGSGVSRFGGKLQKIAKAVDETSPEIYQVE